MRQLIKKNFGTAYCLKQLTVILILIFCNSHIEAQNLTIQGSKNVYVGEQKVYSIADFDYFISMNGQRSTDVDFFSWQVQKGKMKKVEEDSYGNILFDFYGNPTIIDVGINSDIYAWDHYDGVSQLISPRHIAIEWNQSGYDNILYLVDNSWDLFYGELEVFATELPKPNNPTITNVSCGQSTLTRAGTPPAGITWYWQGKEPNGTTTSLGSGPTFIANEGSGVYYIRARSDAGVWSSISGSVNVTLSAQTTWYLDLDEDGLGDPNNSVVSCEQPVGYVSNSDDNCLLSADLNFIYTINPIVGAASISQLANNQKRETITYADGLGRPLQIIGVRAGGDGQSKDIIKHFEYDNYGRPAREYLSYASASNCGLYRPNALSETKTFYDATNYESDFPGMNTSNINPFSEKLFESSPLNRVLKQAAPGMDWQLNSGHEIKMDYLANIDNEVRFFTAAATWSSTLGLYDIALINNPNNEFYAAGQLQKIITYDENWVSGKNNSTEEFKDKNGHIVLKRVYSDYKDISGTVISTQVAHDTYYVYDLYGNLTYVIPPKAVEFIDTNTAISTNPTSRAVIEPGNSLHIKASGSITLLDGFHAKAGSIFSAVIVNYSGSVLEDLCYQYKYDQKNRLVEKKLPGKEWEYIVYDKLDRQILTQDANLRTDKKWLFTKYDVFSRPVYTGDYTNTQKITRTDMQLLADTSTSVYETKQTANSINGTTVYYSNNAFPNINDTNINLLTISYYDDYDFDPLPITVPVPITNAKGLATGSKIRILGKSDWITNWSYYDDKGRNIYTYNKNDFQGTVNTIKNQLDFVGNTLETTSTHSRNSLTTTIVDSFTYDTEGRLTRQTQAINGAVTPEIIVANTYDELGQLISKKVGGKTAQGLQTVDFKYNIRGWLKNINDVNAIGNDLFAFQINYNDITDSSKKLFNGNISQTIWKTANTDAGLKSYTYTYDNLNRLTNAVDNLSKFNEGVTYDKNGNITSLLRLGEIVGGVPSINNSSDFGTMDNLVYTYDGGNKLLIVSDSANDTYGFKDDFIGNGSDTTIDYTYDDNGNMKTDTNKGITAISYNHLNLPTQITIGGQNINYEYDAKGVKQQKRAGIITDYSGGFIYEGNQLKFFSQPEGYVSYNSGAFDYIYQYKDHLGNVRLSYDKNLAIQEENNYYPFGLKQKGYNYVNNITTGNSTAQKYKYNGKELQDEAGLNVYDYGARNYDAALARWMNIDPLAEVTYKLTPYSYVKNNPLRLTDPNGMIWKDQTEADELKAEIEKIKRNIANSRAEDLKALSKEGISDDKKNRINKRIADYDSRIKSLDKTLSSIDALGKDKDHTFDLVGGDDGKNYVKRGEDGVINIQGPNSALQIHELNHAAFSLSNSRGLRFNDEGYLLANFAGGLRDEMYGYAAQYAFSPSSLPSSVRSINEIDLVFLASIKDDDNKPVYQALYDQYHEQIKARKEQEKIERKAQENEK